MQILLQWMKSLKIEKLISITKPTKDFASAHALSILIVGFYCARIWFEMYLVLLIETSNNLDCLNIFHSIGLTISYFLSLKAILSTLQLRLFNDSDQMRMYYLWTIKLSQKISISLCQTEKPFLDEMRWISEHVDELSSAGGGYLQINHAREEIFGEVYFKGLCCIDHVWTKI